MTRNPLQFVELSLGLVTLFWSKSSTTAYVLQYPFSSLQQLQQEQQQWRRQAAFGVRSEVSLGQTTTTTATSRARLIKSRLAFQRESNSNNAETATNAFAATTAATTTSTTVVSRSMRSSNDTNALTLSLPVWSPTGISRQPHLEAKAPYLDNNEINLNQQLGATTTSTGTSTTTTTAAAATAAVVVVTIAALVAAVNGGDGGLSSWSLSDTVVPVFLQNLVAHPQESLQAVIDSVHDMGPIGLLYFGIIYTLAEILAVPATPLTLSAGYLFGVTQGTGVVLLSATVAATVAFLIGKTFLRNWVEGILEENPKFAKLDRAVGEQGFKLLLLVRLSPIFPFALSNYLYGASSIDFASYFWGTLLGFTPGTIAYVYTGMVGKALTLGGGEGGDQPWYIYAGGLGLLACFLKLVTDVASNIIESLDDDENTKATTTTL